MKKAAFFILTISLFWWGMSCQKREDVAVASVTLDKTTLSLHIGETETLTAKVLPSDATDKTVTWASSNPGVASVADGKVSAIAEGTSVITAKAGRKVASCQVDVSKPFIAVTEITLDKIRLTLTEGEEETLTATVLPEDATDKAVFWNSSIPEIATVIDGTISALSIGTTIISATAGEKTTSCEVVVNKKIIAVESVTLNKNSLVMIEGAEETLTASVSPADATDKTVIWASSDSEVATVEEGIVTAISAGKATITATSGEVSDSCEVLVEKEIIDVDSVTLDKTEITLTAGEYLTITATVLPDNATDKTVTWTSSDKSVASVLDGTVTAVAKGTAVITATAGGKTATCSVTVTETESEVGSTLDDYSVIPYEFDPDEDDPSGDDPSGDDPSEEVPVESISLDKTAISMNEGESRTLTATVLPENATDKTVTWASGNESVAKVSNGTVTAISEGTANITASAGEKSASCTVTVNKVPSHGGTGGSVDDFTVVDYQYDDNPPVEPEEPVDPPVQLTLPSFIGNNMVLQQLDNVPLWGWINSNKTVTVRDSWSGAEASATPDASGKWMVNLHTPAAGGPYEIHIEINGNEERVINNVLIGEVWFCSGQSNMEMPMKGFTDQPVEGGTETAASAQSSVPIRICTIEKSASLTPQQQCNSTGWQEHTPTAVLKTSAASYFFAQKLQAELNVPVGIIVSAWAGSSIICWMDRQTIEAHPSWKISTGHLDGQATDKKTTELASTIYNGLVAPVIPYRFRGILWYQGESDRWRMSTYEQMQATYVDMMRNYFNRPNAPFYFVQLAPYQYTDPDEFKLGYFYEVQQRSAKTISYSGIAPTQDVGECAVLHPSRKREVGYRLAYLALSQEYGISGIHPLAPTYSSVDFTDEGKAIVHFNCNGLNLEPLNTNLTSFELAGEDRIFHPAQAILDGNGNNTVIIVSDEVPKPVAVRYGFRNWAPGNLKSSFGIPAYPFRTDSWDDLEK